MNKEIKNHYYTTKAKKVRRSIIPGNTASLWQAVEIATDVNVTALPRKLYKNNITLNEPDLSDEIASYFNDKIASLSLTVDINDHVYNWHPKVQPT